MNAKKRKKKIIIMINNFLMVSSIILVVGLLIFIIQGWTLSQGSAQQTGLVQFASTPQGATVEVGQNTLYSRTNTKANVLPGEHEFKVWREGYETWYRKTDVSAGQILWLNYARLIPKQKTTKNITDFTGLVQIMKSPNGQKLLAYSKNTEGAPEFKLIDIRSDAPKTESLKFVDGFLVAIPEETQQSVDGATIETSKVDFSISSISRDGSRAVVKRTNGGTTDWLLFDLNTPANSRSLTQDFNLSFDEVVPLNDDASKIIVRTGEVVRQLNTRDKTVSATILDKVVNFAVYGNDIIGFAQKNHAKFDVGVLKLGDKPVIVKKDLETEPQVTVSRYYNENYINILANNKIEVYKSSSWPAAENNFKHSQTIDPKTKINSISLNREGRFVVARNDEQLYIHDFEVDRSYTLALDDKSETKTMRWLDDFILYDFNKTDSGHSLVVRDFDGANKHALIAADNRFVVSLTNNGKYIYAVQTDEAGVNHLIQLKMIID